MARAVQIIQRNDWTGGLNLRDDAFQLRENETPSCLNVRITEQGGFERRKPVRTINSTVLAATPRNIWGFYGNGVNQIVVQEADDIATSTGGNFTTRSPDALTMTATGIMRADSMARVTVASSDALYIMRNTERAAFKWNGTATTVLADAHGAYNDNVGTPAGGKMPLAKFVCSHLGYLWVANTVEAGTAKPNRVRFSHPGEPEDWHTDHWFDIGSDDGDQITGLASMGDRLFVFRNRSVWVVSGYSADTFQASRYIADGGAPAQEAVSVGPRGLAFFDRRNGVILISPKGDYNNLWDKLSIALETNTIPATQTDHVTVCWQQYRLFVSFPWDGSSVNTRTFVFDPKVGKGGAWYGYGYGVGPMVDFQPGATDRASLACSPNSARVWELDVVDQSLDDFGSGNATYESYLQTAWYSAGRPAVNKRWRRPSFVVDNDINTTIAVKVYTDYTSLAAKRQFAINTVAASSGGMVWGDPWGTPWGPAPEGEQAIARGSGIGRAYAVSLRFEGPTNVHWAVNAVDLRYIPRPIR